MQVNHINEQKDDNRPENLNLMDCKTNINWGSGISKRAKQAKKPVFQLNLDSEIVARFDSAKDAENQLGIAHQTISKCCLKRTGHKTAGGYKWEYA